MKLGEYLNAINGTKKNVIRESDGPKVAEKLYPDYICNKLLSYHPDAILLVNELNMHGLTEHNLSNIMKFEFLLHVLPKKKRFAKLAKPSKDEDIELIKEAYKYSTEKAREAADLYTKTDFEELRKSFEKGGIVK